MKILVLNPNTSDAVTARIADTVRRVAQAGTEAVVRRIAHGPEVLESAVDEAAAVPYVLDEVRAAAASGFDAIVLAAFCDPGLEAAREMSSLPVYGLEETTLAVSIMLGNRFGILTERPHKTAVKEQHVRKHGLGSRLASVRAVGMGVAEIADDPEKVKRVALETARRMVEDDGAEVVIMGCAAMAGCSEAIERELRVPVLDPVAVTFKVAEGLTAIGIRHSKRGLYASPTTQRAI